MVETSATSRSFPGWDAVPEDIIPDVDDTRDLGSEDKRWAYIWVAIAMVTSLTIGGVVSLGTIDSWFYINASTMVNGSLNVTGNATADYFFGNGSQLTGLPTGDNESWNQSAANALYADISIVADNESWNQSAANALYAVLGYGDDWNKTYADTLYAILGYGDDWNKTYADTLYAILGYGDDWNKTYADTLYANISIVADNESWNQSHADTLYAILGYGDDWNKTYADTLYWPIASGSYNTTYDAKVSFPGWNVNLTWINQTNIFTANQNLTGQNISTIDCIIFDSGGKICSGV